MKTAIETKPIVILHHYTPLWVCSNGIRKCWDSQDKSDTVPYEVDVAMDDIADFHLDGKILETGPKDKELINRVGNKNRHSSTLEHLVYSFEIKDISRACLQELARHRLASYSVKSTRYTLKKVKAESSFTEYTDIGFQEYTETGRERAENYLVMTSDERVNRMSILALDNLRDLLNLGISNDIAKFAIPESFKTELVWTINARSLQNFLQLRTSDTAMWEIRNLAFEVYAQLPEDHKYLFDEFVEKI